MIHLYTDGASAGDPGFSGAGILFVYPDGQVEQLRFHLGEMSNHEAEFRALEVALTIAAKKGIRELSVRTDSQLVSNSVDSGYIKNKAYRPFLERILKAQAMFDLFFIKWIPSKQNKKADELAKQAIREPNRVYEEGL